MNTIIYAYFGEKSSVRLANLCGMQTKSTLTAPFTAKDDSLVIRWGSPHQITGSPWVINNLTSILRSSDKKQARVEMLEAGVNVPTPWNGRANTLPVIGRPAIHAAGSGFYICKTLAQARRAKAAGCAYFSRIFQKTHEFRVHCAAGKILFIQSKPIIRGRPLAVDQDWTILNWDQYILPVCQEALKATEVFGLDFAAVDVMWNARTKKACVCELNCAPALESDFQRNKYMMLFKWFVMTKGNKQSWNWKKFRKADSLAWRKYQLEQEIPKESRQ